MFFLLRTAFWISLLLLVLPFGGDLKGEGPNAQDRASIDALSAVAAAGATISDVGGFCARQPDACAVGGQALKVVGEKARIGASALQDYFAKDAEPAAGRTATAKPVSEGGTSAVNKLAPKAVSTTGGRQTLTPSDRKPGWRSPSA